MHKSEHTKKRSKGMNYLTIGTLIGVLMLPAYALGGTLEAPYSPTSTTAGNRHTLKHIYDLLKTGTTTAPLTGTFNDATTGPSGATFSTSPRNDTLDDTYNAAPQPDGAGATQGQVCSGRKYFSLLTGSTSPTSGTWGGLTGNRDCNAKPVATDGFTTVTESNANTSISINPLISDAETADASLTVTYDTTNTKGSLSNTSTHTPSYNPNGQFDYLASGQSAYDYFTYTVTDPSGAADTATVIITVTGVDSAPTLSGSIANPYLTVNKSQVDKVNVKNFPVQRVDKDVAALTYEIRTPSSSYGPDHGTVDGIPSTNAFIYVPTNTTWTGTDTFSFRACNGASCTGWQSLNINVQ